MGYQTWNSLVTMFFEQAERLDDKPFLWSKHDGSYHPLSWKETAARVSALARGLKDLGILAGDRVVLVSESRPAWPIADLAIMACGAITVPAYTTNTVDDHLHLLNNSGAKAAIVSTRKLAVNLLNAAHKAEELQFVIAIEEPKLQQALSHPVHLWNDILAKGTHGTDCVKDWSVATRRSDVACIIYTSGTGGTPKGVMLSHGAIIHNCEGAYEVLKTLGLDDEVFLSFLPLSHSYEHTAGLFFPISIGAQIYFAEGADTLAANMIEARPTIMTAVPRLYEMMRARILRGVKKTGGMKEKLFLSAVDLGTKRMLDKDSLGLGASLKNVILDGLVRSKVKQRFGGRLKALVSGGAPLNPEVGLFFASLGVRVLQGYGQTESAPVISVNLPSKVKMHTVGPKLKGTEIHIAEDGEILVRGELVMNGYWRNETATRETIKNGWLHTGDVGFLDEDGYLQITDRKKDIIVNSGGDNISPQRVEGFLALEPEIAQCMVYGDQRAHLVGLIIPDPEFAQKFATDNGKTNDLAHLINEPDFKNAIAHAVTRVNASLSPIEKVRKFILSAEAFTIENELMTPTLKIRRHKIKEIYGDDLAALYD